MFWYSSIQACKQKKQDEQKKAQKKIKSISKLGLEREKKMDVVLLFISRI